MSVHAALPALGLLHLPGSEQSEHLPERTQICAPTTVVVAPMGPRHRSTRSPDLIPDGPAEAQFCPAAAAAVRGTTRVERQEFPKLSPLGSGRFYSKFYFLKFLDRNLEK